MKYIRYERIENVYNSETLKNQFNKFIEKGSEIIYYNERKLDDDRFHVVIVIGILSPSYYFER